MAGLQNAEQAVVGALRREEQAVKQAQHLQAELAATQGLLNANQRELQRNLMVMKFRNAEVERLRVCILWYPLSKKTCMCMLWLCCLMTVCMQDVCDRLGCFTLAVSIRMVWRVLA